MLVTKSKRTGLFCVLIITILLFGIANFGHTVTASANMAQPREDRGSGIVFDRHDYVRVDSQILDIVFNNDKDADITAVYTMTNTSSQAVTIRTMFLSPIYNREQRRYNITADGARLEYVSEFFAFYWWSADDLLNWEDVLANADANQYDYDERLLDWAYISAVTFEVEFGAGQTIDVAVSYNYSVNVNFRRGNRTTMRYFLTPARYWKDYGGLTINLTLYDIQPTLINSSLDFERISRGVYRHQSYGIPQSELVITSGRVPLGFIFNGSVATFLVSVSIFVMAILWLILARF